MAKANAEQELKAARAEIARLLDYAESRRTPPDGPDQSALVPSPDGSAGEDEDAWIPPEELRYLDGSEHPVNTAKVFPYGCCLEPDPIRPTVDKLTGQHVYQCRVVDLNPELKDRPHETVVKIVANQQPSPPSKLRFGWVEFDDLTITSYVIDRSQMRIRYSLRAKGIRPAAATAERFPAMWTAAGNGAVTSGEVGAHVITEGAPRGAAGTS